MLQLIKKFGMSAIPNLNGKDKKIQKIFGK